MKKIFLVIIKKLHDLKIIKSDEIIKYKVFLVVTIKFKLLFFLHLNNLKFFLKNNIIVFHFFGN